MSASLKPPNLKQVLLKPELPFHDKRSKDKPYLGCQSFKEPFYKTYTILSTHLLVKLTKKYTIKLVE